METQIHKQSLQKDWVGLRVWNTHTYIYIYIYIWLLLWQFKVKYNTKNSSNTYHSRKHQPSETNKLCVAEIHINKACNLEWQFIYTQKAFASSTFTVQRNFFLPSLPWHLVALEHSHLLGKNNDANLLSKNR